MSGTWLPGVPGYPHDEPGCFDPIFMQWMKDSLAGREPHIGRIGISYMYAGAWCRTNRPKITRAASFVARQSEGNRLGAQMCVRSAGGLDVP